MISLERLVGKQDKFLELIEASAGQARVSIGALSKFVRTPADQRTLDDFVESRRQEKEINARISEELCAGFVTSMEREDIEALSSSLYKIPKTVEKIAERMLLAPQHLAGLDLVRYVSMLERAAEALATMVQDLRKGMDARRVREHNAELQAIEGDFDKIVLELLRSLYNDTRDPVRVVFLKDLFELLEKVTDRCRDAGNIITQIVLKNS